MAAGGTGLNVDGQVRATVEVQPRRVCGLLTSPSSTGVSGCAAVIRV